MATRQFQSQAHLPPRCPTQKRPVHGSIPESQNHQSSSSKPVPWLDDLLTDPESGSRGGLRPLRRSVSDPVTLSDVADSFYDDGTQIRGGPSSMYGPNSPRQRNGSLFSESAIVSALSECVAQENGHYVDAGGLDFSGDVMPDGDLNADPRTAKRNPGQRSRIRKLQYIAELERTVDVLQTLETDLAVRVASLLQQRAAMSMENNKLKQQLARVRREKISVDGEHQILKNEVKRLRTDLSNSTNGKLRMCFGLKSPAEAGTLEAMQMALDMKNLNLY